MNAMNNNKLQGVNTQQGLRSTYVIIVKQVDIVVTHPMNNNNVSPPN